MTNKAQELGQAILDAVFTTTIAREHTFEIAMKDMPVNAILTLLAHGTQRKFNDSVGGSHLTTETKVTMVAAMIEEYKQGIVSKRREAVASNPRQAIARKVMRGLVPQLLDAAQLKAFRAMENSAQIEKLDEWLEQHEAALAPLVDKEVERVEAERKAKATAAAAVTLSI